MLDCIAVGSQVTGVPIVYKYLRDCILDERDKAYFAKNFFPFVPRIDPEELKVIHFIARSVRTKDGI